MFKVNKIKTRLQTPNSTKSKLTNIRQKLIKKVIKTINNYYKLKYKNN